MRLFLTAASIGIPMMVSSQILNSDGDFQLRMIDVAVESGSARFPVACGGLFRALALVSDQDSPSTAQFQLMEEDSAIVGMFAYKDETGADNDAAIDAIGRQISLVSAVYIDWFTFNRESGSEMLSETIRDNFAFCDERLTGWRDAMAQ